MRPFTIDAPQRTLEDLAERLGRTLWPRDSRPPAWYPREWAERAYSDLRRLTALPRGGHFAGLEEPELLADDIRAFFKELR